MFNYKVLVFVALVSCVYGRKIKEYPNVGIHGGEPVDISNAPHMAYFYHNRGIGLFCGGAIISEQYILTASHCVFGYDLSSMNITVVVGTSLSDGNGDVYKIEKVHSHPNYDPLNNRNDICIIKTATPIIFGPNVGKIDLVTEDLKLESGMMLEVTGWGQINPYNDMSGILLQVAVPYVDRRECEQEIEIVEIKESQICAGGKGQGPCHGDSGGPLTLNNTVLVGIMSYSWGFCGKWPEIYANVQYLLPWIRKVINSQHG